MGQRESTASICGPMGSTVDGNQSAFALKVILIILASVFVALPLMELVLWILKKYGKKD